MKEGIEYAEMLEIPVSTVNVVPKKKKSFRDLKLLAVGKVNRKMATLTRARTAEFVASDPVDAPILSMKTAEGDVEENENKEEPTKDVAPMPVLEPDLRLQTEENGKWKKFSFKGAHPVLIAEFATACVLAAVIFLTNVFMPNSAINTFLRSVMGGASVQTVRGYQDFSLTPIVSEYADVNIEQSDAGVLSFTAKCSVYPACNGEVVSVEPTGEGYTVCVAHSENFKSVYSGLTSVYYKVGDEVMANVPFGYSSGENTVEVSFFERGNRLNCYKIDAENCLSWIK